MGCCSSKSSEVKEPIRALRPEESQPNNVLDSPFSKEIQRERDGTIKSGQVNKAVIDAYQDALDDEEYFQDINRSFQANPMNMFPFIENWKETQVPESDYLIKDSIYTQPKLQDPQSEYLIDMENGALSVFNIYNSTFEYFKGKIYSNTARAIFVSGSKMIICGGRQNKSCFLLDVGTGELVKQGNLNEAREYHALAVVDDFVLASGGMAYEELESCEIFFRGSWSRTGKMNFPRSFHASVGIDKCVYVVGGLRQKTIEKWNGGEWSEVGVQLPFTCSRIGICPLTRNSFLIVGGESQGQYLSNTLEVDFIKLSINPLRAMDQILVFDSPGSLQNNRAYFLLPSGVISFNSTTKSWE